MIRTREVNIDGVAANLVDLVKTSMKWAGTHDMIIVFVDIMKPPMDWALVWIGVQLHMKLTRH